MFKRHGVASATKPAEDDRKLPKCAHMHPHANRQ